MATSPTSTSPNKATATSPDPQVAQHGIGEGAPARLPHAYGCSKGAADQYVLDYARSFGLRTAVIRMSCIYGRRQMGTEDQGWVAHFLIRALEGQPITLYGDGKQVRDILDVDDAVNAYLAAWERIDQVKGRAFNLGGGPRQCRVAARAAGPYRRPDRSGAGHPLFGLARGRPALLRRRQRGRAHCAWAPRLWWMARRRCAAGALAARRPRPRATRNERQAELVEDRA
jgi:nucleoside-diphosphate-sugar epimerase